MEIITPLVEELQRKIKNQIHFLFSKLCVKLKLEKVQSDKAVPVM